MLKTCPRSLFIFDEVEKMPHGIFELISSLLDYNKHKELNTNRAVYIFVSNAHGTEISRELARKVEEEGKLREDTEIHDFKPMLELIAFNEGGLQKSSLIENHLIDYYFPFLPLEERHVQSCIRMEFQRRGKTVSETIVRYV